MKILFFLIGLLFYTVTAQIVDTTSLDDDMSNYIPAEFDETSDPEVMTLLTELKENPINLNSATIDDLQLIPFLSSQEAEIIVAYRKLSGLLFSKAELFMIKGLREITARKIMPYVDISDPTGSYKNWQVSNLKVRSRFKKSRPEYKDFSNLNKINFKLNSGINAGFLTDKDEGEKSYTDFYSGYVEIKNVIKPLTIILGDYNIEAGQGLMFWSPYSTPKGSEVISSVYKKSRGAVTYGGSNEALFFRGLSVTTEISNFSLLTFYSNRKSDASFDSSGEISRLISDGYHRTKSEQGRRDLVNSLLFGGVLTYNSDNILTGISVQKTNFSHKYKSANEFEGLALNLDLHRKDINIFGEVSLQNCGNAIISGININPLENMGLIVSYRNYSQDYISNYSSGFGEKNGSTQNEKGFYTALKAHTIYGELSFYIDEYTFPYAEFFQDMKGYDVGIGFTSKKMNNVSGSFWYKLENKDYIYTNSGLRKLTIKNKQNLRIDLNFQKNPYNFKIRGDIVFVDVKGNLRHNGISLMQELKCNTGMSVSVNFRCYYYKTDSFLSAIYQYETGMPGLLENNVMYGEGVNISAAFKFQISRLPALYIKYCKTFKESKISLEPEFIIQTEWNYRN